MATISGKDGNVSVGGGTPAEIIHWTFTTRSHNLAYASSATEGYKRRVAGIKDGTGSFAFKFDAASPITGQISEGDAVTLVLSIDASHSYTVPALIDSLRLEVDINTGDIVGGQAEFSTNGAWTTP